MKVFFALLLAAMHVLFSSAFTPRTTFQAARVIPPGIICAVKNRKTNVLLQMSEPEKTTAEDKQVVAPTSGTFYDDEVEPTQKEGISDSMKQRLMREASTGLDSDQKQTNVILYIIGAVALLVILGGQGIFY